MTYTVKEIFYTLQGEGVNTGRAAVFCRFTGCNLWSGLERDRSTAICKFCDTDFVWSNDGEGGKYISPDELAKDVLAKWPNHAGGRPLVVCTGGEPLLQVDDALIEAFHGLGFEVAVETNGTLVVPNGIDWICVSPKARTTLLVNDGDELKLVFPQDGAMPELFEALPFRNFFLQPMDGPDQDINILRAIEYCKGHPKWRLSIQMHKVIGIR